MAWGEAPFYGADPEEIKNLLGQGKEGRVPSEKGLRPIGSLLEELERDPDLMAKRARYMGQTAPSRFAKGGGEAIQSLGS